MYLTEQLTSMCGDNTVGVWYRLEEVFIPRSRERFPVLMNVANSDDCKTVCESWTYFCSVIIYDPIRRTCQWFEESKKLDYQLQTINSTDIALTRICSTCKLITSRVLGDKLFFKFVTCMAELDFVLVKELLAI